MTHLKFEVIEEKPKTKVYAVISNDDKSLLGEIRWHPAWRQYIFEPEINYKTIWSDGCLKELYEFLKKLKEERKRK